MGSRVGVLAGALMLGGMVFGASSAAADRGIQVGVGPIQRANLHGERLEHLRANRDLRAHRMGDHRGIKYPWHQTPKGTPVEVPELDPNAAASALAMLLGAFAILSERRRTSRQA